MAEVAALKDAIPAGEAAEKAAIAELEKALVEIPNLPLAEVPDGKDEHDNVERHRFGERPEKRREALRGVNKLKEHFELGEALGQMDFEAAAKLSGARFVVLKRRAGAARPRARPVHARHAHERARLHGSEPAASGARRGDVRHGATAEIRAMTSSRPCASTATSSASGSSRPPRCRSPTSSAIRSWPRTSCRCASPRSPPASAPRRARPARTRAA